MSEKSDRSDQIERISQVVTSSIGWAKDKDKALLYDCFAQDPELFWFSPSDDGTIHGFRAFEDLTDNFFMSDDFRHVKFEIRELYVELSQSKTVAWFRARLDDINEWQGQPANWENVRWTGVLESRDGCWKIVQMHFSSAAKNN